MLTIEEDRIIITETESDDGLQAAVVYDVLYPGTPDIIIFQRDFTIVGDFRTDNDDYDHGYEKITVIRRLSDQREFGYIWWWSPDGDVNGIEPNGEDHGFEFGCTIEDDWDTFQVMYVWLPVEQVSVPTYQIVKPA
jgi:hypothetical protein